ncbi:MAG TPA: 16S rRNA (adenine(1518)-N(6)/adenine(1519)-N(6))-dimethyltransferase RsmA [Thermomicrobiales bacterium]|nr:16S rRNA (adenine(1518)-N(6)/adenine(1519)-N(6))-dimethyltransferase RsmA [Thermomicrobiales bacterium]
MTHAAASANQRTRSDWERVLRDHDIRPTRSMGQNFLVDPAIVDEIVLVAGVGSGDRVVEIGPGMGILTRALLGAGARVTGVELDRDLATFLRNDLAGVAGFSLVERDARHVDVVDVSENESFAVVANLPYSVATVVIRHFVEAANPPERLTVMVQREVAERMTADPPGMSLLGLATQLYSDAGIAFIVPPDVFLPPPKVESAVVKLDVKVDLPLDLPDRNRLFELATMAFQRKRKTVANGLSMGLDRAKSEVDDMLRGAGIDAGLRPQALGLEEWIEIAKAFRA